MPKVYPVPTACPKCGGKLWDNRETKKNPKAPDFKCRDKSCDGVHWPPRDGVWVDNAGQKQPPSGSGAYIPAIDDQEADEQQFVNRVTGKATTDGELRVEGWQRLFNAYDLCFAHALAKANEAAKAGFVIDLSGLSAMTATLLIAGKERGLAA